MGWGREEAVSQDEVQMNPPQLLWEVDELSVIYCAWGDQVSVWLGATKLVSDTLRRGWVKVNIGDSAASTDEAKQVFQGS